MIYILLSIIPITLQVIMIIHVIRNRKDFFWIYLLIFLPVAGCIVYFIIEILPGLRHSETVKITQEAVSKALNPTARIKHLEDLVKAQNTVHNRQLLAEEYLKKGFYSEAIIYYKKCLIGPHSDDRVLLLGIAKSYFLNKEYQEAKSILEDLNKKNQLSKVEEKLLLIKTNEASGQLVSEDYKKLYELNNSFEAGYYYILCLKKNNNDDEAKKIIAKMEEEIHLYKKFNNRGDKLWLNNAKKLFYK